MKKKIDKLLTPARFPTLNPTKIISIVMTLDMDSNKGHIKVPHIFSNGPKITKGGEYRDSK
jgi:hypothetical protein